MKTKGTKCAKKRQFSPEFKREAVRLLLAGKKTRAQIARDLDIRADLLFKWQQQLAPNSTQHAEPENKRSKDAERIRQLEREVEVLREERDILKKAAEYSIGQRNSCFIDCDRNGPISI